MPLPKLTEEIGIQPYKGLVFSDLRYAIGKSEALNQSLDKMSSWAFKKMEKRAEEEAQEWSLENPPSPEKLYAATMNYVQSIGTEGEQAKQTEFQRTTKELAQPSNVRQGTVFADAVEKARTLQIKASLSQIGQREMAMLSSVIESGIDDKGDPISLAYVKQQINARVNGLTSAMAQVDLKAASALNAEMLTYANPMYRTAVSNIAAANIARQEVKINNYLETSSVVLAQLMSSADENGMINSVGMDGKTSSIPLDKAFMIYADNIGMNVVGMSQIDKTLANKSAENMMKMFNSARLNGMIRYFSSPEFATTAVEAASKLRKSETPGGKMSGLFATLSDEVKSTVIKKMYERNADDSIARQREQEESDKRDQRSYIENYLLYSAESDPAKKGELRAILAGFARTKEQIDSLYKADQRPDNFTLRMTLWQSILRNPRNGFDIIEKNSQNLSEKDQTWLYGEYSNLENKEREAAISLLRRAANFSEFVSLSDDMARKNALKFSEWLEDFNSIVSKSDKTKPIEYRAIADRILREKKK